MHRIDHNNTVSDVFLINPDGNAGEAKKKCRPRSLAGTTFSEPVPAWT